MFSKVTFYIPFSNKINIYNNSNQKLEIIFNSNGEYQNSILLNTKLINEEIIIEEIMNPLFEKKNDKLSAHKLMSSSFIIKIPDYIPLKIEINDAKVKCSGNFLDINLKQKEGVFNLISQKSNGEIFTEYAEINIFSNHQSKFSNLKVTSKKGNVFYHTQ